MAYFPYPKVYALNHFRSIDILKGPVLVTEKVDGSQFSFTMEGGRLRAFSRSQEITDFKLPCGLFTEALAWVRENKSKLKPDLVYYGEVLQKPRHNVITYGRVPKNHIILFDIAHNPKKYLEYMDVVQEGHRIGLETVPLLFYGLVPTRKDVENLLSRPSILGGFPEGVVLKNYRSYHEDGTVVMSKYVSEKFEEIKSGLKAIKGETWMDTLGRKFATEARWSKALQHLSEAGSIQGSKRDIPALLKEAKEDIEREGGDEIKEVLWKHYGPDILAKAVSGLPGWYMEHLLERAKEGGV